MQRLSLKAAGRETRIAGTVRITASMVASHYVLPPILASIRRAEPDIQIELVPSDETQNLLFRDADIAVRMYRPDQLDVVTRHVTDVALGIFGATQYLNARGRPQVPEDLHDHDLIGYDTNDMILRRMRELGFQATRDSFALRCDNQATYWELLRHGGGIGFTQAAIGRADPLVEELHLGLDLGTLPVWLTAHPSLRQTPRLRRVWDLLTDALGRVR